MTIDSTYPWGEVFQMRLLAFLLQDPEKMYDVVEPQFFSASPLFVEICRVAKSALKDARHARLERHTLIELLRPTVGEEDSWSLYKETLKTLFKLDIGDKDVLYKLAQDFGKESRYREALIGAERDVNAHNYDRVHERIDKLRTSLTGAVTESNAKGAIRRFPRLRKIPREAEWDSEKVFREVYKYLITQVHFTRDWQPVVVALWAMGTYLHQQFPCYRHLWLNSSTTQSGKTKLLDVLWTICHKAAEPQLEPTSAVLFRFPSAIGGTLLLDEIDNLSPEKRADVISILNHYNKDGVVFRNVPGKNKKYTLEKFSVYCPKVIAGINNLPDTLQDRCVKIYLHRKRATDKVERFMPGAYKEMEELRNQIDAWAVRDIFRILGAYRDYKHLGVPKEADERLRNILEPLFAIASALPNWVGDKLSEATRKLARDRRANEEESNAVVLGLQVLRENFPEDEDSWRLRSDQALDIFEDDIPGIETQAHAQALLRRFGLRSTRVRVGKKVLRAYVLSRRALDRLVERYGLEREVA